MRKFTSLMLMLLCAVTAWAGPTDLPELTTDVENPVWYTIKNTRSASYLYWNGDNADILDATSTSAASLFYFTGTETDGVLTVKVHNYATSNLFASQSSWTETGTDVTIGVTPHSSAAGLYIGFSDTFLNERNYDSGYTTWSANDEGSIFVIEEVTDFSMIIDVPAAKAAAKAEVELLATATNLYPAAETTVAAIEAVTPAATTIAGLNAAVEEVNALVAAYKKTAYEALSGKYFSIKTPARNAGYLEMGVSQINGVASLTSPAAAWKFVENNGKVNIYNEYTNKYLCEPGNNSVNVAVTAKQEDAGAYELLVSSTDNDEDGAVIKLTSNGKSAHLDGYGKLVRWDNGGASEFNIVELTDTDLENIAEAYKTTVLTTLDEWATLTVVFDATLINNAKTAINAVTSTGIEACAAYDAELVNVTDAVAAKMFSFQTKATDAGRNGVWVSANASTMKAIGADTQDYNAIWSLRHAGGTSFYMYNELNKVYMGAPSSNCPLTTAPSVTYTFEIVDAENSIVEMKCNSETLHASNHDDNKLINYDNDEDASRWYITTIDQLTSEKIEALAALQTAYNAKAIYADAEIGEGLGQYKGNKDAIVAALPAAEAIVSKTLAEQATLTVEEINNATTALNNAVALTLNMPVAGKYYRIKSKVSGLYVTAPTNTGTAMIMESGANANNIFYWDNEKHFLVYGTGMYINGKNHAHYGYKAEYTFEESKTGVAGAYTIKPSNANYWYDNGTNLDVYSGATHANCNWIIEEVTELPVTVSIGYATLYAPVALAIPEGVTAHTVTLNGEWATLSEPLEVIPANTGVVLQAEANTYNFAITTADEFNGENDLNGSIARTLVTKEENKAYYILAVVNEVVGFYNPTNGTDNTTFYNGGHKAYIAVDGAAQSNNVRFGEGTTGIENVTVENGVKAIYDLTGRRVESVTAPGIYIVNGKKVLVK